MIKVSVIIPAYNEAATLLTILRQVNDQSVDGIEFEVIVVDDGSGDDTPVILSDHPKLYSQTDRLPTNQGKGAAVRRALELATGDFILFQDADLEYDPADYAKLLAPILRFDGDVVIGSRLVASPITRVSYFWHKFGNRLLTFIFNIFNNTTFTDIYSCYLVYRRNLVLPAALRTKGWEQHAEILSTAVRGADRIFEVPVNYYGRTYDEGKKIRAHHAWSVIWTIIRCRLFG
jgi:glycosyltransferase involved in cell wall biosynthesis